MNTCLHLKWSELGPNHGYSRKGTRVHRAKGASIDFSPAFLLKGSVVLTKHAIQRACARSVSPGSLLKGSAAAGLRSTKDGKIVKTVLPCSWLNNAGRIQAMHLVRELPGLIVQVPRGIRIGPLEIAKYENKTGAHLIRRYSNRYIQILGEAAEASEAKTCVLDHINKAMAKQKLRSMTGSQKAQTSVSFTQDKTKSSNKRAEAFINAAQKKKAKRSLHVKSYPTLKMPLKGDLSASSIMRTFQSDGLSSTSPDNSSSSGESEESEESEKSRKAFKSGTERAEYMNCQVIACLWKKEACKRRALKSHCHFIFIDYIHRPF